MTTTPDDASGGEGARSPDPAGVSRHRPRPGLPTCLSSLWFGDNPRGCCWPSVSFLHDEGSSRDETVWALPTPCPTPLGEGGGHRSGVLWPHGPFPVSCAPAPTTRGPTWGREGSWCPRDAGAPLQKSRILIRERKGLLEEKVALAALPFWAERSWSPLLSSPPGEAVAPTRTQAASAGGGVSDVLGGLRRQGVLPAG